ncbi:MAG: Methyltransferase type 11 [Candidatus Eremiobacteraeota bacterium]|nr:Methyltransferase type 11 [Candidatus Eremiobacteraeota bacterium]
MSPCVPFGAGYVRCTGCQTLVYQTVPDAAQGANAAADLYGAQYWTSHQTEAGLPPLRERARTDVAERCLHWLRTLVRFRPPPARLLEIGCSHGGFLHLARLAGYDAVGIELSAGAVELARAAFAVDVRAGTLESAGFADGAFDVVASFDVLEHLAQPERSLREMRRVLRRDGLLLIQTPEYRERSRAELEAANDPFLKHLGGPDHLFLFSKRSIAEILRRTGFPGVAFEPPVFAYDMFFAAACDEPVAADAGRVADALCATGDGRLALAMLDVYERTEELRRIAAERLTVIEGLRAACDERLQLIERLDGELRARR